MAKAKPSFNFGANAKRPPAKRSGKGKSRPAAGKGKGNAWRSYTGGGSSRGSKDFTIPD